MVRELSKHQCCFLFDCCIVIARFALLSCYSSAKTRIQPVRAQQNEFLVVWAPGKLNKVDYFTKLHAPIHHHHMHFVYLHPPSPPANLAQLSLANLSCRGVLNPSFQSQVTHLATTGIPQVNYSTNQQQLPSKPADVSYLTKTPITTKPIVSIN